MAVGRDLKFDNAALLCFLCAGIWLVMSALFLAQPAAYQPGLSFPNGQSVEQLAAFWEARPGASAIHTAQHIVALVMGLTMIGLVHYLSEVSSGRFLRWSQITTIVGMLVIVLSNVRYLSMEANHTALFTSMGAQEQKMLVIASTQVALDPFGILEFLPLAVWILVLRPPSGTSTSLNTLLRITSIGAVAGLSSMVIGAMWADTLLEIGPLLGTPCLCAWLIGCGVAVRRQGRCLKTSGAKA